MNKLIKPFFIALLGFTLLSGAENKLELRASAFVPSSKLFREIYGTVGPDFQLEYSYYKNKRPEIWGNFASFYKHGCSTGMKIPTKIFIENISFGLKFRYYIDDSFFCYLGVGPSFGLTRIKNRSFIPSNNNIFKAALGGIVKSGVCYYEDEHLFFDIFLDYLYQPVNLDHTVDIGGTKIGAGWGYSF